MISEDFTSKIQKYAFSYIELIITMALVVVALLMSAPFLSGMSKKDVMHSGQYICYARYDNGWKLFENVKYNTENFPAEDSDVTDRGCEFYKPNGNILNYKITLIGGGGSGSMPYFASHDNEYIYVAEGQDGNSGEKKDNTDNFDNLFDDDGTLIINFCNKSTSTVKACIGYGGEPVSEYDEAYVTIERLKKITESINNDTFSAIDISFLNKLSDTAIVSALRVYLNNKTKSNKDKLISKISGYNTPDRNKNSGKSGESTKIMLSSGEMFVAKGGLYGLSDPNKENALFDKSSEKSSNINNEYYYIPKNKVPKPSISGGICINKSCYGKDANELTNETRFNNYGAGGKAGAIICNLKNTTNFQNVNLYNNSNKIGNNTCHTFEGGRGAGGAIIITWN